MARLPGYLVVLREAAKRPLAERLALLENAGLGTVIPCERPADAFRALRRAPRGTGIYAVDLDSITAPVIAWCLARRLPVVLDVGDDAYALARAGGGGKVRSLPRLLVDTAARRLAPAIVYRGRLHPIIRTLPARSVWCPDTVPDAILSLQLPVGDPQAIATFGSIRAPDGTGWTYGRELVDALEADRGLRGTIVGRGPGVAYFRRLARERSLRGRLEVLDEMPLEELVETISRARFVTSYQSNDRAGWVRTTGKLPLVLGSGRVLLSSDVGEAALVLPTSWRLVDEGRARFGSAVAARVGGLGDIDARDTARRLAENYRRSAVASRLRRFLESTAQDESDP